MAAGDERRGIGRQVVREIDVGRGDDFADHADEPQPLAVLGREKPRDAVVVQFLHFRRNDHATTTAEHLDVRRATLAQEVEHVLEELDVAALVRRNRNGVRVFLDRAVDDLVDRPVVAEMDHFAADRLQDPAHDVDRRVVAVEQRRGRDEADPVLGFVDERLTARVVHDGLLHAIGCARGVGRGLARRTKGKLTPPPRSEDVLDTLNDVYVNVNTRPRPTRSAEWGHPWDGPCPRSHAPGATGTVSPLRGRISPSQRRISRSVATSDSLQLRAAILTRPPRFHRRDTHAIGPPLPLCPALRHRRSSPS